MNVTLSPPNSKSLLARAMAMGFAFHCFLLYVLAPLANVAPSVVKPILRVASLVTRPAHVFVDWLSWFLPGWLVMIPRFFASPITYAAILVVGGLLVPRLAVRVRRNDRGPDDGF